jgi:flagellar assembly protein FliH
VCIGGRQRDAHAEARAEKRLGELFPQVSLLTAPDGSRLIPIEQVFKIDDTYQQNLAQNRQEGFDDGRDKGYRDGLERGRDDARQVLSDLNRAISDTVSQREALLEEARRKVLELTLQISRKVTFDAVEVDPDVTAGMISAVIDQLVDRSHLKIKVNPKHVAIVEQHIEKFMSGSAAIKEIAIEPDPRVRYGGCFIETPSGDIDARLESQLDVIDESLKTADDPS